MEDLHQIFGKLNTFIENNQIKFISAKIRIQQNKAKIQKLQAIKN